MVAGLNVQAPAKVYTGGAGPVPGAVPRVLRRRGLGKVRATGWGLGPDLQRSVRTLNCTHLEMVTMGGPQVVDFPLKTTQDQGVTSHKEMGLSQWFSNLEAHVTGKGMQGLQQGIRSLL